VGRDFHISERDVGDDGRLIAVAGDIDLATAPLLQKAIEAAVTAGKGRVELDLSGVAFLDSAALEVFVRARHLLASDGDGGDLILSGIRPSLMPIFEITGLARIFVFDPAR
jgi:anti-anti-sigma factor